VTHGKITHHEIMSLMTAADIFIRKKGSCLYPEKYFLRSNSVQKSSHIHGFVRLFFCKYTRSSVCAYIKAVFTEFFFPQYTGYGPEGKKTAVNVEHPFDFTIPFEPELGKVYHRFFPHGFRVMNLLFKNFFSKWHKGKSTREFYSVICEMISGITRYYYDCSWICSRIRSTTSRPPVRLRIPFILIHLTDPHFHCVPSLHVLSMYYFYAWVRTAGTKFAATSAEALELSDQAFHEATIVTEAILFVKQHSVNCIAASFFMLTITMPFFEESEVRRCILSLFTTFGAELPNKDTLRSYMLEHYQALVSEYRSQSGRDWKNFLIRYLKKFPEITPGEKP